MSMKVWSQILDLADYDKYQEVHRCRGVHLYQVVQQYQEDRQFL